MRHSVSSVFLSIISCIISIKTDEACIHEEYTYACKMKVTFSKLNYCNKLVFPEFIKLFPNGKWTSSVKILALFKETVGLCTVLATTLW